MKVECTAFYDVGPALLFDEAYRERWKSKTYDDFIVDYGWSKEAVEGYCCYLKEEGKRQFEGRVEILINEEPPEHVRYAVKRVNGLRLSAPSGRLVLDGAASLTVDPPRSSRRERPVCRLEVVPGDYLVDLFGYVPHELRLEEEAIPGELPPTRWWKYLRIAELLLGLLSIGAALLIIGLLSQRAFVPALRVLAVSAACWGVYLGMWELAGEGKRARERKHLVAATLADLPATPRYTVALRSSSGGTKGSGGGIDV